MKRLELKWMLEKVLLMSALTSSKGVSILEEAEVRKCARIFSYDPIRTQHRAHS